MRSYLVGGAVRDALLGRDSQDLDIAVEGDAVAAGQELAAAFEGRCVVLDRARGIVRALLPLPEGDIQADLNSAPEGIEADLAARDFTIDAMAVSLNGEGGKLIDPHGGWADLELRTIRTISPSSLSDDPARLLRAVRLAAQLRFTIVDDTAADIRLKAGLVSLVAPERLRDELSKTLAEAESTASLRKLDELGLLTKVFPELEEARGVEQPKEHYWDVLNHLLETPGQVERVLCGPSDEATHCIPEHTGKADYFEEEIGDGAARRTVLKLAALLHDVSKPSTKHFEPSGRMRFFGHDTEGAEVTEQILKRLRFCGRTCDMVRTMVRYHLRPSQLSQKGELPTQRAIYRYYRDLGDVAVDTLYLNMADYLAARGPDLELDDWAEHCRMLGHVLAGVDRGPNGVDQTTWLIDGHDVMSEFSLGPGPIIGEVLEAVREAQSAGEIVTRQEALDLAGVRLGSGHRRA